MTQPFIPPTPQPAPNGRPSRRVALIGSLAALLVLGFGVYNSQAGSGSAAPTASAAPSYTQPAQTPTTVEPTETPEPSQSATEEPTDQVVKYGAKLPFTLDGVDVTMSIDAPKRSTNMFDRNNAEFYVKLCNAGTDTVEDVSASALELYAVDNKGGNYDLYGAYRSPEFPIYSGDGKRLRPGKCMTGWVGFANAWKGKKLTVNMDVEDVVYTWRS